MRSLDTCLPRRKKLRLEKAELGLLGKFGVNSRVFVHSLPRKLMTLLWRTMLTIMRYITNL